MGGWGGRGGGVGEVGRGVGLAFTRPLIKTH